LIFSLSVGSAGEGLERYTLYVPFTLSPGSELQVIDTNSSFNLDDYYLKVEKLNHFFAITIGPFASEFDAINFYGKIQAFFSGGHLLTVLALAFRKMSQA